MVLAKERPPLDAGSYRPILLAAITGEDAISIALWCVLTAGLSHYPLIVIAKSGAQYANNNPRDWLTKQEGFRRRANAAYHLRRTRRLHDIRHLARRPDKVIARIV